MTTRAARALLSEMHPCDARDNAHSTPGGTWHMSTNRMASILDAVERQAIEAAIATTPEPEDDHHHPETTCPICRYAQDHLASTPEPAPVAEGLDVDRLARARDLVANYCWNEDDSGDEDQIVRAYDLLVEVLGHSTEESVGATLAREYAATSPSPETE